MSKKRTIRALLTGRIGEPDPLGDEAAELRRWLARIDWAKEVTTAWRQAQQAMDDRCMEAVEWLSEAEFDRLYDAEQAKVDAVRAPIDAVIEKGRWPRELYFRGDLALKHRERPASWDCGARIRQARIASRWRTTLGLDIRVIDSPLPRHGDGFFTALGTRVCRSFRRRVRWNPERPDHLRGRTS